LDSRIFTADLLQQNLEETVSSLTSQLETQKKQAEELVSQLLELESKLESNLSTIQALKDEVVTKQQEIDAHDNHSAEVRQKLEDLLASMTSELEESKVRIESLSDQKTALEDKLLTAQNEIERYSNDL